MNDRSGGDLLSELRAEIDEADKELTRLFQLRMELARRVGAHKKKNGLPILDRERERQVLASRVAQANDPELSGALTVFYETLMRLSRERQQAAPENRDTETGTGE